MFNSVEKILRLRRVGMGEEVIFELTMEALEEEEETDFGEGEEGEVGEG
jgi:hypothetical protein